MSDLTTYVHHKGSTNEILFKTEAKYFSVGSLSYAACSYSLVSSTISEFNSNSLLSSPSTSRLKFGANCKLYPTHIELDQYVKEAIKKRKQSSDAAQKKEAKEATKQTTQQHYITYGKKNQKKKSKNQKSVNQCCYLDGFTLKQ